MHDHIQGRPLYAASNLGERVPGADCRESGFGRHMSEPKRTRAEKPQRHQFCLGAGLKQASVWKPDSFREGVRGFGRFIRLKPKSPYDPA